MPTMLWTYLLVAVGGALGSLGRFWLGDIIGARFGATFPWGTIVVNISGSFLIGFFYSVTGTNGRWLAPPSIRAFLMTGICGGYTTFSSFSLQTLNLIQDGQWLYAGGNVIFSVILCMVGVWLGYLLGTVLN
jgi:CrcB protein